MARNDRRREKNRRQAERQQGQPEGDLRPDAGRDLMPDAEVAPDPLSHATPDEELLEEHLAIGRPDPTEVPSEEELEAFQDEQAGEDGGAPPTTGNEPAAGALATTGSGGGGGRGRRRESATSGDDGRSGDRAVVEHKESAASRLVGFLQGCVAELQRTQWPDRRQVAQATGVVLGFVIVAGAFLGVADLVASKLINLVIK